MTKKMQRTREEARPIKNRDKAKTGGQKAAEELAREMERGAVKKGIKPDESGKKAA